MVTPKGLMLNPMEISTSISYYFVMAFYPNHHG